MAAALPYVDEFVEGHSLDALERLVAVLNEEGTSDVRELLDDIDRWRSAGKRVAVARVVDVEGSGPRGPGAAMAVSEDGEVAGSVSGGCVEGAVVSEALAVLAGEAEPRGRDVRLLRRRGVQRRPDVRRHDPPVRRGARLVARSTFDELCATRLRADAAGRPRHRRRRPAARRQAARLAGDAPLGSLGDAELDRVAARDALAELDAARSGVRHYGPHGETTPEDLADSPIVEVFVDCHAAPPQMWIFGAVDFTAALAKVAKLLGYRVTVCDAREVFATRRRFPMADEVVVSWPAPLFDEQRRARWALATPCASSPTTPSSTCPAVIGALATGSATSA